MSSPNEHRYTAGVERVQVGSDRPLNAFNSCPL
jgi:hypothetical protein